MEFTGERWIPSEDSTDPIQQEHLARYAFALDYVKGKNVLDIACGTGYGAYKYATDGQAKHVVGADIDEDSIDFAQNRFKNEAVEFSVADAQKQPFADERFDVVTSFETIEHLPDYRAYLDEVWRVLAKDGMFIVSTPDKQIYHFYNLGRQNLFHVHEFEHEELEKLLADRFSRVTFYGQTPLPLGRWKLKTYIRPIKDVIPHGAVAKVKSIVQPQQAQEGAGSSHPMPRSAVVPLADSTGQNFVYYVAVCKK